MVTNREKELTGLCLSLKKRQSLQNNVAKIVFYDRGYSGVCGVTMVTTWIKDVNEGYKFGKMIRPLLGRHTGRISIMSQIEKKIQVTFMNCIGMCAFILRPVFVFLTQTY